MSSPRPVEQPPVMRLIRERRKQLHLSYARAAALMPERPISDTRWRQLENGYRVIRDVGRVPESAPPLTLAGMAYVVRVTAPQLNGLGQHEAADELIRLTAAYAREDGDAQAEARRMVADVSGLTKGQQDALISEIASTLRRVREQALLLCVVHTRGQARKLVPGVCKRLRCANRPSYVH